MARTRRGENPALIDRLREEPSRFDVNQTRIILDAWQRCHGSPSTAPIQFRSSLSLGFPASDIESVDIDPCNPAQPPVVTVRFMGLGGAMGPLPAPYTEQLERAARRGDTAGRDFLDLFNHRLVTTALTGAQQFRPALQPGAPEESALAAQLLALLGLRGPASSLGPLAKMLLPLTALVHQRPLSQHAVERAVSAHFLIPARVIPFRGAWLDIPPDQRSALGHTGRHQRLGDSAVLGRRVWDQSAAITLHLGPMSLGDARNFLPGSNPRQQLELLVGFLVEEAVDVRLALVVATDSVPPARLSKKQPLLLGLTSWLGDPHRLRPRPMRLGRTAWLGGRPTTMLPDADAASYRLGGSKPCATVMVTPRNPLGGADL